MQNQTPSGVLVRELTNVALTPGAAEHLPPAEYPQAIRNVYANAWTASDVAHLGESAAYLQQLGYIDLAAALNNRAAMMSAYSTLNMVAAVLLCTSMPFRMALQSVGSFDLCARIRISSCS